MEETGRQRIIRTAASLVNAPTLVVVVGHNEHKGIQTTRPKCAHITHAHLEILGSLRVE